MKIVDLPEVESMLDLELAHQWRQVVEARNWQQRGRLIDAAILDSFAISCAGESDMRQVSRYATICMTAALELVSDLDIRSTESALAHALCAHYEWRQAAHRWFEINRVDSGAAFEQRTGLRMLHAALVLRRHVGSRSSAAELVATRRQYERVLEAARIQGFTALEAASFAVRAVS